MDKGHTALSYRLLCVLVLAALLLSLAPLLLLGRFALPCADDFSYGAAAHAAYLADGSLPSVLRAALRQVRETYFGWQGTFSAIFLMSLQPAVFGLSCYALTPVLMLLSLLAGTFCLCLALLSGTFGLPRSLSCCAAGLCSLLCIQLMPSPVQGLYWYNGAIYYTFFHGLALLAFALGLRLLQRGGVWRQLLLCLLALLLGGTNYVTALCCSIVAVSALILLALLRNRARRRLLLPTLILLAAFAVNTLAPGNAVRQASVSHTPQALRAILDSFAVAGVYALRWLKLPLVGTMLLLGVLLWPALGCCGFSFRLPGLVTLYSVCLFAAMFCPGLYALGEVGDQRLLNIIYYSYVLLLGLNLCCWLGWLRTRRKPVGARCRVGLLPLLLSGAVCLLCCALYLRAGGYTSLMALGAMRSGEARAFHDAGAARYAVLEDATIRQAELAPYPCRPYVLFFDDITADPQDWRNLVTADYFDKDSVRLSEG